MKNKYSGDNKYLAIVTENGLWIKDEIDNKINIIVKNFCEKFNFSFYLAHMTADYDIKKDFCKSKYEIVEGDYFVLYGKPHQIEQNGFYSLEQDYYLKSNPEKKYHVSAIGNAMLDVVCEVSDDFLKKEDILKGNMQLISQERSMYLLNLINPIKKTAGGSAANTVYTLSKLGLRTSYIGKVANDKEGDLFHQDLKSQNVNYKTKTLSFNAFKTKLFTSKSVRGLVDGPKTVANLSVQQFSVS